MTEQELIERLAQYSNDRDCPEGFVNRVEHSLKNTLADKGAGKISGLRKLLLKTPSNPNYSSRNIYVKISKKLSIAAAFAALIIIGAVTLNGFQSGSTKLAEVFINMDQLKEAASEVIEVSVLETQTIVYEDIPFTISKAKVLSKAKGKLSQGEEIKVIETGGKYISTGENPKEAKGIEIDWAFEGIQVMKKGEHLILFVTEFTGPQVEGAYIPLGVYQGKFKVNSAGYVKQQAPSENRLQDYIKPLKLKEFKEKLGFI